MIRIEEIAENVFVHSTLVPVRNRSWRPPDANGHEPFNVYIALSDKDALLIDTGPPAHRTAVLAFLDKMIGARRLTVMATRSELDCISNIGAIVDRFPDLRVLGTMKNLPLLGLVHMERAPRAGLSAERIVCGRSLADYGFAHLTPIEPVIKTLSTIWMVNAKDDILFSSDFFSGDLLQDTDHALVRRDIEGFPSPAVLREHLLAKFDWLARADTSALLKRWDRLFDDIHPILLAPGLGRIHRGQSLVSHIIADYRTAVFGGSPKGN